MDTWCDISQVLKLLMGLIKEQILGEREGSHFLVWKPWERKGEKRELQVLQASLFGLRSSIGRISSGQSLKFIASTRDMHGYQK